ncbi:MAG: hypothetical protein JWQ35_41 [Bacteriovoracaceae bacterium]|nr:hypothetical protein [Bacteriovoracaceae bacterium]
MADFLLYFVAVSASIYLWGIIRTAIWLLPPLVFPQLMPVVSSSLLTFFTITGFFAPYQNGFFDLRKISKKKWIIIFILVGLSPIGIPDSLSLLIGFIVAPIVLVLFYIFKHPANLVIYIPKRVKWILLFFWTICVVLKLTESILSFL